MVIAEYLNVQHGLKTINSSDNHKKPVVVLLDTDSMRFSLRNESIAVLFFNNTKEIKSTW